MNYIFVSPLDCRKMSPMRFVSILFFTPCSAPRLIGWIATNPKQSFGMGLSAFTSSEFVIFPEYLRLAQHQGSFLTEDIGSPHGLLSPGCGHLDHTGRGWVMGVAAPCRAISQEFPRPNVPVHSSWCKDCKVVDFVDSNHSRK